MDNRFVQVELEPVGWQACGPVIRDLQTDVEVAECSKYFSERADFARLIAAAPDLLRVAMLYVQRCEENGEKDQIYDWAIKAIESVGNTSIMAKFIPLKQTA
jgi:hypothetical protein